MVPINVVVFVGLVGFAVSRGGVGARGTDRDGGRRRPTLRPVLRDVEGRRSWERRTSSKRWTGRSTRGKRAWAPKRTTPQAAPRTPSKRDPDDARHAAAFAHECRHALLRPRKRNGTASSRFRCVTRWVGRVRRKRGVTMDSWVWILIAVAAIIVVAAVVFAFVRRRRQGRELRDWFAPESLSKRRES